MDENQVDDKPERDADQRDFAADQRDDRAAERDASADLREEIADERERLADEREDELDERERELDRQADKLGVPLVHTEEEALSAKLKRTSDQVLRDSARHQREDSSLERHAEDDARESVKKRRKPRSD